MATTATTVVPRTRASRAAGTKRLPFASFATSIGRGGCTPELRNPFALVAHPPRLFASLERRRYVPGLRDPVALVARRSAPLLLLMENAAAHASYAAPIAEAMKTRSGLALSFRAKLTPFVISSEAKRSREISPLRGLATAPVEMTALPMYAQRARHGRIQGLLRVPGAITWHDAGRHT